MRTLFLFLLFLPAICFAQESKSVLVDDGRPISDAQMCKYPSYVTEILNGHCEKLGNYFSYKDRLDEKLKKQKPYSEYFLMEPFNVGMTALQLGDTTTLTLIAYKEDPNGQLANVFDVPKYFWEFQGWLIPVYKMYVDRTFQVSFAGQRELFRIRFTGQGVPGEQCFLLKNDCFVCADLSK